MRLPKFNIENRFLFNDALKSLGVRKAFTSPEFDQMFQLESKYDFSVSSVIQKARISVSEWGTEAGAVTILAPQGAAGRNPEKEVYFYADHPFVFVIGEKTSGTILFEGVFAEP